MSSDGWKECGGVDGQGGLIQAEDRACVKPFERKSRVCPATEKKPRWQRAKKRSGRVR